MAKYEFHKVYNGPRGPHLSFLTRYSLTRQRRKPEESISIHPSSTYSGKSRFEKDEVSVNG